MFSKEDIEQLVAENADAQELGKNEGVEADAACVYDRCDHPANDSSFHRLNDGNIVQVFGSMFKPELPGRLELVESAAAQAQGRRPTMEDYHVNDAKEEVFAIYDGHCHDRVAAYLASHFHHVLKKACSVFSPQEPNYITKVGERIQSVCVEVDQKILHSTDLTSFVDHRFDGGSAAVAAMILGGRLFVINIGDSRGVVVASSGQIMLATQDHKPTTLRESTRITELVQGSYRIGIKNKRVEGCLALSRSFGDKYHKPLITVVPDVYAIDLEKQDVWFLILACDGIWDVIHSAEAANIVATIFRDGGTASKASLELCKAAYQRNSMDNLSAMVVHFERKVGALEHGEACGELGDLARN